MMLPILMVVQSLCVSGNQVVLDTRGDVDTAAQVVVVGEVTGVSTSLPGFAIQFENPAHPGGYSFQVYGGAFGQFSGKVVLATLEGTRPFSIYKDYVEGGATQVVGFDLTGHAFYHGTLDCPTKRGGRGTIYSTPDTWSLVKGLYR